LGELNKKINLRAHAVNHFQQLSISFLLRDTRPMRKRSTSRRPAAFCSSVRHSRVLYI